MSHFTCFLIKNKGETIQANRKPLSDCIHNDMSYKPRSGNYKHEFDYGVILHLLIMLYQINLSFKTSDHVC